LIATGATVLALGVAGCGDDEEEPASSAPEPAQQTDSSDTADAQAQDVQMLDFEFAPPTITIATGGEVTWVNEGQAPHDATADDDSFATELLDPGESESVTFDKPGSYSYICSIHPQMTGTIEVVG
jgi:plastocyanin